MTQSYKSFCLTLLLVGLVLTGCSKLKNEHPAGDTGGGSATDSNRQPPASPPSSSNPAGKPTTWEANATSLEAKDGDTLTLACSPGGQAHTVWGSDIYTSDSSICTAAVHSGLITFQQGGAVTIEVRPGRPLYGCSERNGVTTGAYGAWQQSFVFKTADTANVVRAAEDATAVMWNTPATIASFEVGKTIKFSCPANGKESNVWGTDTYTLPN